MNFKLGIVEIAVLSCLFFLPKASFATTCSTTSLNNLLGTSCSIGNVSFAFLADSFSGVGVSVASILFTPDASSPLAPGFILSGPFRVSATGLGQSATESFSFFLDAHGAGPRLFDYGRNIPADKSASASSAELRIY